MRMRTAILCQLQFCATSRVMKATTERKRETTTATMVPLSNVNFPTLLLSARYQITWIPYRPTAMSPQLIAALLS